MESAIEQQITGRYKLFIFPITLLTFPINELKRKGIKQKIWEKKIFKVSIPFFYMLTHKKYLIKSICYLFWFIHLCKWTTFSVVIWICIFQHAVH